MKHARHYRGAIYFGCVRLTRSSRRFLICALPFLFLRMPSSCGPTGGQSLCSGGHTGAFRGRSVGRGRRSHDRRMGRFARRRGRWNNDRIVGQRCGVRNGGERNRDRTKQFADRGDVANQRCCSLLHARRFFNERKASLIGSWQRLCIVL